MRAELGLMRIEPNFNPALGFVRRRGVNQVALDTGHTWRPLRGPVRTYFTGVDAERIEYLDNGDVQSQSVAVQALNVELDSQDFFGIGATYFKEGLRAPFMISSGVVIPTGEYSFDTLNLNLRSGDQRAFGGGLFVNDGSFYDGERFGVGVFGGWRGRHFRANLNYQYNDIAFPGKGDDLLPSGLPRCTTPDCAFVTRVVRLSLEAIFSARLSWVNLIQYDNVSRTVGVNSRLHWIPQAGREGFLVINHNLTEDPLRPDEGYHTSFGEVTVKYSYTFRF
jgi:hypothetical protein